MELVSQIINDLIDEGKSLNSALLKTKVLASRIQNKELLTWVNYELSGYPEINQLPSYRKNIHNDLKGTVLNGYTKLTNIQIPTSGLDENFERNLRTVNLNDSITVLEKLVTAGKSSVLISNLRAELTSIVEENWRSMDNPFLQIISANRAISKTSIHEILTSVRNKLLEFVLEIDAKFGNLTEIKDLQMKKEEVSSIVNNTIIKGDGNILNTGHKVKIESSNKIYKYTKEQLKEKLEEIGITQEDSAELIEIVDVENPDLDKQTFGKQVNGWIAKMVSKTVDGSWNVAIGAAGSMLAEIIKKYYGM